MTFVILYNLKLEYHSLKSSKTLLNTLKKPKQLLHGNLFPEN